MKKNKHRSLIIVNDGRVVGTISDGDIRKALINNALFIVEVTKIMNKDFHYLFEDFDITRKNEYLDKHNIFIVPIVDQEFNLLNVLTKD